MTRTVWIAALALAAGAAAGCKDSNPNYITFDAQAADVQASDVKGDVTAPADVAADHGGTDAPTDAAATDAVADTSPTVDSASDGALADAVGADAVDDTASSDSGDGQ